MDWVDRQLQEYLATLPQGYVPTYSFAGVDGQLYAYPLAALAQRQWTEPGFAPPEGYGSLFTPTAQALATNAFPGAVPITYGDPGLDPTLAQDLDIWNRWNAILAQRDDSFRGVVANVFGNGFTLPAMFASAMMGANLIGGLTAAAPAAGEVVASPLPATLGEGAFATGEAAAEAGAGGLPVAAADVGGSVAPLAPTPVLDPAVSAPVWNGAGWVGDAAKVAGTAGSVGSAGSQALGSGGESGTTALDTPSQDRAAFNDILHRVGQDSGGGWLQTIKDVAPVLGPALSGLGSIAGGVIGGNAATDAAKTQADAAREANRTLWDLYQQNRADLQPYRETGYGALGALRDLTGQPLTYGPYTATAPLDPARYAFSPDPFAFRGQAPLDPTGYAFDPTAYAFRPPSGQDVLNQDPSYSWRVSEGQKALERSAAARGMQLSGSQLKDLQRWSQGLASQEYQNAYTRRYQQNQTAYERALQGNQLGYSRALTQNQDAYARGLSENQLWYDRALQANQLGYARDLQHNQEAYQRGRDAYQTNLGTLSGLRTQRYNELAGLSGTGQTAVNNTATLGAQTGQGVAGNQLSAGAALAAGTVGGATALNQGISGVGNAVNAYNQFQLLNNYYNTLASLTASRRAV
jgi:hypothetical protein